VTCAAFELEPQTAFQRIDSLDDDNLPRHVQWDDLPYHLMTNEKVIIAALGAHTGPRDWTKIPIRARNNPDIICVAFQHHLISFDDIPEPLRYNHQEIAFLCVQRELIAADDCSSSCFDQAIENGELEWPRLPTNLRHDPDFARSLTNATSQATLRDVFANIPALCNDDSFWRRLLSWSLMMSSRGVSPPLCPLGFKELFETYSTFDLRANSDFMLAMCSENAHVFPYAADSVKSSIWQSALALNVGILHYLDHETQKQHPDLVQNCISQLSNESQSNVLRIGSAIAPSFWRKDPFVLEWFQNGLLLPTELFFDELFVSWMRNRNLALAFAMNAGRGGESLPIFFPQEFLGDVDFMTQVVERNPDLCSHAIGKARDPWVMVTAFSSSLDFALRDLLHARLNDDRNDETIGNVLLAFVRDQLSSYKTFSSCILGNMLSTQSMAETGSTLTMLNQGPETCLEFKKTLAAYLSIPTGKLLSRLRRAERNICEAIAPWTSPDV
jgi:hypothetical protein